MTNTGIIILAHGSRGERGSLEVPEILDRIIRRLKLFLAPDIEYVGAALQFNHPDLDEAAEILIAKGVRQIVISPYFLFTGRHLTEDLPEYVAKLKTRYPEVRFTVTANPGFNESFVELMAQKINEACPASLPDVTISSMSPEEIQNQSLKIIEQLLPGELTGDAREVTKRIVHAGGDLTLAGFVRFSPTSISSGLEAIRRGCTLYTDVRMAAAGISARLVKSHGGRIICALDESGSKDSGQQITRSAKAMYGLGPKLNSNIIVIGNAPTALLAVIEMIDRQHRAPALVIGMPVGFVQARESKAELMRREVPYITIEGTRGGSPLAAAAVNALLRMA